MIKPRLFLCSGVKIRGNDRRRRDRRVFDLDSLGYDSNVHVQLDDVARVLCRDISPRLTDLLEIAAYVFAADCTTDRGEEWTAGEAVEPWGRDFHFVIPVRDTTFWNCPDVRESLLRPLGFLTNDRYAFDFVQLQADRPLQGYLVYGDDAWPFRGVDRVVMFSGGLDSLAGAVDAASAGERLVLVSHRSKGMVNQRQKGLVDALRQRFPGQVIHVPVWVTKDQDFGREHTQRSRSFLFAALGAVVAASVEAGGVRFYENGIVSVNLPPADEVQRSRASRTTHPWTLRLFSDLLTRVVDRTFVVDNPFMGLTKTEVVQTLVARGGAELIGKTCSCAHTGLFQSQTQWHCGTCSQCIDRRIAIEAAGQQSHDPETDYVSNVFTGPRKPGYEQNMAVDFVQHALTLDQMADHEIAARFNSLLARAARGVVLGKTTDAFANLVALHKRHGHTVAQVLQDKIAAVSEVLVRGELEDTSLLGMVLGKKHLEPSWRRYCEHITALLQAGLPAMCETEKPKNEKRLQEMCEGILKSNGMDLTREWPFMQWSSTATKPDWSAEPLRVWVEAKYVRQKSDLLPITEAIAADVTKYGDNARRVLFVVYDPYHLVTDEDAFATQIHRRRDMLVKFIR